MDGHWNKHIRLCNPSGANSAGRPWGDTKQGAPVAPVAPATTAPATTPPRGVLSEPRSLGNGSDFLELDHNKTSRRTTVADIEDSSKTNKSNSNDHNQTTTTQTRQEEQQQQPMKTKNMAIKHTSGERVEQDKQNAKDMSVQAKKTRAPLATATWAWTPGATATTTTTTRPQPKHMTDLGLLNAHRLSGQLKNQICSQTPCTCGNVRHLALSYRVEFRLVLDSFWILLDTALIIIIDKWFSH